MEFKNYNVYFFILVLATVTVVVYFLIQPLLVPLLVAVILAHMFHPVYQRLLKMTGNRRGLSSSLVCLLAALIIIIPFLLVATLVVKEAISLLEAVSAGVPEISEFVRQINTSPYLQGVDVASYINQDSVSSFIRSVSQGTLTVIQGTYRGIAHLAFISFVMFFSLFYLLIDGKDIFKTFMKFSPLRDKYEALLAEKFNSITRATLKGTFLVAIAQGFLGAILFLATGVSSPIFLGLLMTVASVIPALGSFLIWVPVGIVMIILGYTAKGVIILAAGALVIGSADNILRQKLIGRDYKMHPILILFSTIGGIILFGATGFLIGPIIMALFLALWEIYFFEFKDQLEQFNR